MNILLIEDNPVDQDLVREYLLDSKLKTADLHIVERLSDGNKFVLDNKPDVVLLDLSLPDSFGLDGLNKVRTTNPLMPVIILTGLQDNVIALDAIKNGAQDYLVKGTYTEKELERSIRYALERKKAEIRLYKTESRLRAIFNHSAAGIPVCDLKGRFIEANPAFREMLGYSIDELKKLCVMDISFKEDFQLVENAKRDLMDQKHATINMERRYRRKDGSVIWGMVTMTILNDMHGNPDCFIAMIIDITEQKQQAIELEKKHKEGLRYQSMLLSTQINPHFIFNALNAVQYFILDREIEPAINFVSNFSTLMRAVLSNSMKQYITIEKEVEWLNMYISLEKQRFNNKFNHIIEIDTKIDPEQVNIPPMLLQPFIENTIIHGIAPMDENGEIVIKFVRDKSFIHCIIDDNGIGREKAMKMKQLRDGGNKIKSYGVSITQTKLEILNEVEGSGFDFKIEDKVDVNGDPTGTQIKITFPACLGRDL